jgi:hypothetical protein
LDGTAAVGAAMARATYGAVHVMWPFLKDASDTTALGAVEPDAIIFAGERVGKGIAFRFTLADESTVL